VTELIVLSDCPVLPTTGGKLVDILLIRRYIYRDEYAFLAIKNSEDVHA